MPIRVHAGEESPAASPGQRSGRPRLPTFDRAFTSDVIASIRQVIFAFGPLCPRTAIDHGGSSLGMAGVAGERVRATMVVHNTQLAVVAVSPMLTALRRRDGVRWSPEYRLTAKPRLVPPDESTAIDVEVTIANDVPTGVYEGDVLFLGAAGRVPIQVVVAKRVRS
jgi:predicted secreted protein